MAVGAARGGGDGGGAAQVGEGGFGAEPLGVVAGGDQQLAGGVDPDPGQGEQGGRGRGDQRSEVVVELVEFALELLPAAGEGAQGGLGGGGGAGEGPGPDGYTGIDQGLVLRPSRGWRSSSGAL